MTLYLRDDFAAAWSGSDPFERVERLEGEVFRELEARRTLRFELGGRSFFAKIHRGIGWWEIVENLLRGRLPVLGAENEWRAIERLKALGVDTMTAVAYGKRGLNPARQHSFIVTEDLVNTISLEDFCRDWPQQPPTVALKRALIERVAWISRQLHQNGVNHRDYYICHFLLDISAGVEALTAQTIKLSLIDLHRAQIRRKTPQRWIEKDLSGLYFSAMEIGLTRRDYLRFIRTYRQTSLRQALAEQGPLWRRLQRKADKLMARLKRKGDKIR
ncbi:lipopolysaccharide core heptose(I) kinase RfaP [Aestuariirhabdus litorea]|uniref:Lipopolysaccharide core heptose(I) kinase n=1 Tax=Aestuariirhabdus litorea TaxID=2528527 RepID=A0A3P3VKF8_9GAMM|nr:lipopolysaccharide core heptose(I) kinase RfaP [Aestuariirhabdus litorea]RRJ82358.1 lipopolysaccharide core heptose(I) kinase RfaP [Aestuariirhabdus litorea]RWW92522.1 lipopolysaccharide core heptose(I) kinase RfaP [Endozoicomonadaceae bacterium GTF-13]